MNCDPRSQVTEVTSRAITKALMIEAMKEARIS